MPVSLVHNITSDIPTDNYTLTPLPDPLHTVLNKAQGPMTQA